MHASESKASSVTLESLYAHTFNSRTSPIDTVRLLALIVE